MTQHQELARFALNLTQQARVPANQQDLRNTLIVQDWLAAIAAGKLLVTDIPPLPPEPADLKE